MGHENQTQDSYHIYEYGLFKSRVYKIFGGSILLLLLVLTIVYFKYGNEVKEDQLQQQSFVSILYTSLSKSIQTLDELIENQPQQEALVDVIHRLELHFHETDQVIGHGIAMVDAKLYSTSFFTEVPYFLNGIKMEGPVNAEVPPLAEDGKLNNEEIVLLETIKGYLVNVQKEMTSEETGHVDLNLSIETLNAIILSNLRENVYEIYEDAYER